MESLSIIFEHVSNEFTGDAFFVAAFLGSCHRGQRFQLGFLFASHGANTLATDFLNCDLLLINSKLRN